VSLLADEAVRQEFLSWLERWIGTAAFQKIPKEKTRHGSQMMNAFESVKQQFDGSNEDGMDIQLPKECGIEDDESKNIEDRILAITK
jgi:hypothetical protein